MKNLSIIITILTICGTALVGYTQLGDTAEQNKEDIKNQTGKVESNTRYTTEQSVQIKEIQKQTIRIQDNQKELYLYLLELKRAE